MADQFTTGGDGDKVLKKFFKNAPAAFQRTSAGVLTGMAKEHRLESMRQIGKHMIVRHPNLVRSMMRFQMAKKTALVSDQESMSGAIKKNGHDSWEHVEEGSMTRATRFTEEGRGGNAQNVGMSTARIGKAQTHEGDYKLKGSGDTRIIRYFQAIEADPKRRRKTFMLSRRFKGMDPGIYRFVGGRVGKYKGRRSLIKPKIRLLSTPGTFPGSRFKPKKIDWNHKAAAHVSDERFVRQLWVENINHELNKLK